MHGPGASKLKRTAQSNWSTDDAFLSQIIETQNDVASLELDPPVIMRLVTERTCKLTGADGGSVQLIDGEHLNCRAVTGLMDGDLGVRFATAGSLSGACIRERQALYCEDSKTDPRVDREMCERSGARSMICAPLLRGGEAVGVLNVVSLRPGGFEPRHVDALRLMAGVVAAALHHAAEFEIKKKLLTERTRALAALRESEDRFRGSFEYAAIGMALVGLDGRWLRVNRSICEIVGYTETELLVTDFQSITHPDDLDADLNLVKKLIAGQIRDYQMTKRYFHKQGHIVWVLLSVTLVRDAAGEPLYFISQIQDISARQRAEDALRVSEEAYRTTFDHAGVGLVHTELSDGRFIRVNRKLCAITGYSADELKCMSYFQITHPEDVETNRDAARRLKAGEIQEYLTEKRYIRKDGSNVSISLHATAIRGLDGKTSHCVAIINDITDRRRLEWITHDRSEVLEMVAEGRPLGEILDRLTHLIQRQVECVAVIMLLDGGSISVHAHSLPGVLKDSLQKNPLRLAAALAASCGSNGVGATDITTDDAWIDTRTAMLAQGLKTCFATPLRSAEGTPLGVLMMLSRLPGTPTTVDEQLLGTAARIATIGIEHHQTTGLLAHAVRHDPLTRLPNRILFEDRLQQALASARRSGKIVAVFAMDLDRFKTINDTLGHHAGDVLLQQFAQRVNALLRETDTLARTGGDEFLLLLPDLASADGATRVATVIIESLGEPFELAGEKVMVTSSIGIALFPRDGADGESLQHCADAAMYQAKKQGRNGFATAG